MTLVGDRYADSLNTVVLPSASEAASAALPIQARVAANAASPGLDSCYGGLRGAG